MSLLAWSSRLPGQGPGRLFRPPPAPPITFSSDRPISLYALQSAFGLHPAGVSQAADCYAHAREMGVCWDRDGFYMMWVKALGGRGFDVFDFHWYGTATGDHDVRLVVTHVRRMLDELGFRQARIWCTEMGTYSVDPRDPPAGPRFREAFPFQTEQHQTRDLIKRFVFPLAFGVERVFWAWSIVEGFGDVHDNDFFDNTGLVYDGIGPHDRGRGKPKKAFYAYRLMTQQLEGAHWPVMATVVEGRDNLWCFRLPLPRRQTVWVAWWDDLADPERNKRKQRSLTIRVEKAGRYRATIADFDSEGKPRTQDLSTEGNSLIVPVTTDPVFVRGPIR